MKKITLKVNGREMSFYESELIKILESHFANLKEETKIVQKLTEGEYFEVNPNAIDRKLFLEKKEDFNQEETRKIILQAFYMVDAEPEKYDRPFKTLIPQYNWKTNTGTELIQIAKDLGGYVADDVEQALEWAQRIANGETWEEICNEDDTATWQRLVRWESDGRMRIVGGSQYGSNNNPPSYVSMYTYNTLSEFLNVVPLVVFYE